MYRINNLAHQEEIQITSNLTFDPFLVMSAALKIKMLFYSMQVVLITTPSI